MSKFNVGDIVKFIGNKHYAGTTDSFGVSCTGGIARVDQVSDSGVNPIHIIAEPYVNDDRSDVFGWVREGDVQELDVKTLTEISIERLVHVGVINSPDYWKQIVQAEIVENLNWLIIKAAKKIERAGEGYLDTFKAVDRLTNSGIITTPDYWKNIAAAYSNIAALIQKLALAIGMQLVQHNNSVGNEAANRQKVVDFAQSYLGYNEWDGSHREIVDGYNAHSPLAMGYRVQYYDSWCATFVSFVAIKTGFTNIIPTECSCERQINLFKDMGRFQEDENYIPQAGDIIYYAWDDDWDYENTDNRRFADHVGIVISVDCNGDILVIEGNKNDCVEYRTVQVNGKFIRGYGLPDYARG